MEAADKIIALYPQLKSNRINPEPQLWVKLLMNQEGEIVQAISYKLSREFDFGEQEKSFVNDLDEIFLKTPKFRPVRINKQTVYYEFTLEVNL